MKHSLLGGSLEIEERIIEGRQSTAAISDELMAFCPKCKTLEIL